MSSSDTVVPFFVPQQIRPVEEFFAALLATEDPFAGMDLLHVDLELRLGLELLIALRALPCMFRCQ